MRIPFPKYISLRTLFATLAVVLLIQLIQGTDPAFAVLMLIAQLGAAAAFNRLGGMNHMAGAFCLFAILPNVTIPELTHIALGQPGDYNLAHPIDTAGVCAVFFLCVLSAALFVTVTGSPQPVTDRIPFSILELRIVSAVACFICIGMAYAVLTSDGPVEDGSFLAALNHFYVLLLATSIMLATYVRLAVTNGRSSMNWYVAFLLILALVPGILGASKEGMLLPVLCWLVVVAASGHRFSVWGTLAIFGCCLLIWKFVYPFSQNARSSIREANTLSQKVGMIIDYFRDPSQFPDWSENLEDSDEFGAESSKVNILNRVSLLKSIDMLIDADQRLGYTSYARYAPVFLSVVPHALWPDRPSTITSNELGHKAGFRIGNEDTSTGIEIGSPALFFDVGGWVALAVCTILTFSGFFYLVRRLVGSTEHGIWALVPIGAESHRSATASPAEMFLLLFTLGLTFLFMVGILKIFSYVSRGLISRPIASRA